MKGKKEKEFVESKITPETFEIFKIDILVYTYLNGKIKAGGWYNKEKKKIYINLKLNELIKLFLPLVSNKKPEGIKKLIFFQNKPFILAIYPVVKPNNITQKVGYLFIGKFISFEDIKIVKELFNLNLKNFEILKLQNPKYSNIKFLNVSLNEITLLKSRSLNEKDIALKITYLVKGSLIKDIIFQIINIQTGLSLIVGLVIFLLINLYIVKPLLNLIKEVKKIKKKEKFSINLNFNTEEIKNLALTMNAFLKDISLKEKIYTAIAEKSENLVILFNKNGEILFKNRKIQQYLSSEELNTFVKNLINLINSIRGNSEILYKEIKINEHWINVQIIPIEENLFLAIGQDITASKEKEEKLFKWATHDFLTKLYNRRYFEEAFERVLALSKRGEKAVLLFIDCDDLKKVNDTYGHLAGDEVLKTIAKVIKDNIRKEDIAARWGGDEFVVVLNKCEKDKGIRIAKRISESIARSEVKTERKNITPTVSIGVVEIKGDKDIKDILKIADELAYEAKRDKKDKIKY